jgi:hypothetical protein
MSKPTTPEERVALELLAEFRAWFDQRSRENPEPDGRSIYYWAGRLEAAVDSLLKANGALPEAMQAAELEVIG